MKGLVAIALLVIFCNSAYSMSFYCKLPSKLNSSTVIAECIVVEYVKGLKSQYSTQPLTGIKMAVTASIYNPTALDTFIIPLYTVWRFDSVSRMQDSYIESTYPLNVTYSFVGATSEVIDSVGNFFESVDCTQLFQGQLKDRIAFDYKSSRQANKILMNSTIDSLDVLGHQLTLQENITVADIYYTIETMVFVPELFQAYIDLAALQTSKNSKERKNIVTKLLWCSFIDKEFILNQKLSKKHTQALLDELLFIQKTWPN